MLGCPPRGSGVNAGGWDEVHVQEKDVIRHSCTQGGIPQGIDGVEAFCPRAALVPGGISWLLV